MPELSTMLKKRVFHGVQMDSLTKEHRSAILHSCMNVTQKSAPRRILRSPPKQDIIHWIMCHARHGNVFLQVHSPDMQCDVLMPVRADYLIQRTLTEPMDGSLSAISRLEQRTNYC